MSHIKGVILCFAFWSSLSVGGFASEGRLPSAEEAQTFVTSVGKEILEILQNQTLSRQEQEDRFRKVLRENFDLVGIGYFTLGRFRRYATASEKKEFLKVFEDVIVESYSSQFKHYSNESLTILSSKEPDSQGGILVISKVLRQGNKPLNVYWKVFLTKNGLRVLDLIIEGVSQSLTQRKEYNQLIYERRKGIQGLIDALKEQIVHYNNQQD